MSSNATEPADFVPLIIHEAALETSLELRKI